MTPRSTIHKAGTAATATEPARLGGALTSDSVELAVAEIRQLSRVASLELALGIGEIVFRRIFDGDIELLRKTGRKHMSFRRLALHPDVPISASALWRCVATYELSERLPAVKRAKHIGVSHIREVFGLADTVQEKLLSRADSERWTVAELTEHARSNRQGHGGRPPKPALLRVLDTLFRVSTIPVGTFADRKAIAKLSADEVMTGLEALEELGERLHELRRALLEARDPGE